jgi:hypothetical protein
MPNKVLFTASNRSAFSQISNSLFGWELEEMKEFLTKHLIDQYDDQWMNPKQIREKYMNSAL